MTSRDDMFSGVKPVEDRHKLDEANLAIWMAAHVEGYEGPLEVYQFKGGQSNPTYRLDTPGHALRPAPQAVRQAAAVGPRGRPRVSR